MILLTACLAFVLTAGPALAQSDEEFCAIPEGCDLDGDGTAETPAGTPVPAGPGEAQYGPGEEFCAIPEGCDASATPDPADGGSASPDPADDSSVRPASPSESPAPPTAPETGTPPPLEESATSAGSIEAASPAKESAKGGSGSETPGASAPSANEGPTVAGPKVLPETGGALPMVPIFGVLLVACGLVVRGMAR